MNNVKNAMEAIVEEEFKRVLPQLDCCHCEECQSDILAIALNSLPPRYVSTYNGSLYAKVDNMYHQNETDVLTAIVKATEAVKARPRHTVSK